MVGEPIEQRCGHALVACKDLGPIGEGRVGGHNQAGLLVALVEEAERVLGTGAVQGDVAQLVDDDQVMPLDVGLQPGDLALFACIEVGVGQLRRREEPHLLLAAAGIEP